MIDFSLTDAQREVQRTARAFAEREILPRIGEMDASATYDRTLYEKMGSEGLLGLPIPERYGGAGMDYIAFALLCEEMERADTAFRVILSVHTGLNSLTLLQWGSEEQKERYLAPQARGEKLATFGLAVVLTFLVPRRWRWVPPALAIVVGVTRMHVGVHYPLDVVGGALIGTAVGLLVVAVLDPARR